MGGFVMAIPRYSGTSNSTTEETPTHSPSSSQLSGVHQDFQTADMNQIQRQYQFDAESKKEDRIDTGALLPKDMTVKLVRAESANWETFIQVLYSITLTLFGLFLGSWVSAANTNVSFTSLEVVSTFSFGIISLVLIVVWSILKIMQSRQGIKIPYDILNKFND
jgi:hypothetical protein